jgi:hypothetical protein
MYRVSPLPLVKPAYPKIFVARIFSSIVDDFVKSRDQTAKKKDPDARRANPEE